MDEHVTLTNRSSFGCTPHHVLCATSTCPETLTSPGGDARGRVREKRASDRFVTDLYTCHVYLARQTSALWPPKFESSCFQRRVRHRADAERIKTLPFCKFLNFTKSLHEGGPAESTPTAQRKTPLSPSNPGNSAGLAQPTPCNGSGPCRTFGFACPRHSGIT